MSVHAVQQEHSSMELLLSRHLYPIRIQKHKRSVPPFYKNKWKASVVECDENLIFQRMIKNQVQTAQALTFIQNKNYDLNDPENQ